ncbi:MAG: hypothetical protein NVS9B15_26040 [Acidobacteriaceae bacterium]
MISCFLKSKPQHPNDETVVVNRPAFRGHFESPELVTSGAHGAQ